MWDFFQKHKNTQRKLLIIPNTHHHKSTDVFNLDSEFIASFYRTFKYISPSQYHLWIFN